MNGNGRLLASVKLEEFRDMAQEVGLDDDAWVINLWETRPTSFPFIRKEVIRMMEEKRDGRINL